MITEKQFALGYSSFWHGLLPMLERHIRTLNLVVKGFAPPMISRTRPVTHGMINELAFRLFAAATESGQTVDALPDKAVQASIDAAVAHVRGLRQLSRAPIEGPDTSALAEGKALAKRHARFFRGKVDLRPLPRFLGCGSVGECAGDVLAESTLFEIKSGQRSFRSADLRQLLIYCALNFAAKSHDIDKVCLVNPRAGTYVVQDIELLCRDASGASAVEILASIVEFCSESHDRYQIG